jgi:phosphomannomutase
MSGHLILADSWCRADDAVYIALRTLQALGRRHGGLADFRNGLPQTASTPEIRLPCPESRKCRVIAEVAARLSAAGAQVDMTDGLRVTTLEGWWLLRASGTESKLALRCEADDAVALQRLCVELTEQLRHSGIDSAGLF